MKKVGNKKGFLGLLLMICLSLVLAACTSSESSNSENGSSSSSSDSGGKTQIRVGGSTTSTWIYGFTSSWAEVIKDKVPDVTMNVQATAGSSAHYLMIENGDIEIGSGFTPSEFYASKGELNFEKAFENFRAMMPVTDSKGHVFTMADSKIEAVKDLDGVKLGLGSRGSPTSIVAEVHAEALGIEPEYVYGEASELMDMLRDGRIDAIWYYAGAPWASVIDLASQNELRFLSFSDEEIATLQEAAPFTTKTEITPEAYDFLGETITVPGAIQTLIVGKDVPEDVVYGLTKASWENWDQIAELVPAAGAVKVENAANLIGKIHPGALKYYEEVGVEIPEELKP
jgi:uncharacterized protein